MCGSKPKTKTPAPAPPPPAPELVAPARLLINSSQRTSASGIRGLVIPTKRSA